MKAKREVNGTDTANARIKIDYSKKKPVVSFRYPDRNNQLRGSMFPYIFLCWIIINFSLLIWVTNSEEQDLQDLSYKEWVEYKTSEEYLTKSYKQYIHPFNDLFFGVFESNKFWIIIANNFRI